MCSPIVTQLYAVLLVGYRKGCARVGIATNTRGCSRHGWRQERVRDELARQNRSIVAIDSFPNMRRVHGELDKVLAAGACVLVRRSFRRLLDDEHVVTEHAIGFGG